MARHRRGRLGGEGALALAMLAPAFALLGLVVLYPIGRLGWLSLRELRLNDPTTARLPFVGLLNYADLWADPRFWSALVNTGLITLVTVPGAVAVGLGLALLANLPYRRRWPVRLALLLPWALPLVFSGLIFAWFFDSNYGVVNDLIRRLGGSGPAWLSSPALAMTAVMVAIVWKTSSFVALILLAGLQTVPLELLDAARADGATRRQRFAHVTWPLLRPALAVAIIFRTVTAVQTFDIPYAMTRGGPGDTTETLAMYIRTTTLDYLDFGYGAAQAVVMFALATAATVWHLRRLRAAGA